MGWQAFQALIAMVARLDISVFLERNMVRSSVWSSCTFSSSSKYGSDALDQDDVVMRDDSEEDVTIDEDLEVYAEELSQELFGPLVFPDSFPNSRSHEYTLTRLLVRLSSGSWKMALIPRLSSNE